MMENSVRGNGQRNRVLVVEDEQLVGWSLLNALKKLDVDAEVAECAEDAYTLFLGNPFDLVVTDQNLPRMTGCEFASLVKKIAPSVPVILISALEFPGDNPCNVVDYFVEKPFNLSEITALILSNFPPPVQASVL